MIFGEVPEEIRAAINQQIDHQNMVVQSSMHDIQTLFEELSAQQLETLVHIFKYLGAAPQMTGYMDGLATGILHAKHGLCIVCHRNHADDLNELQGDKKEPEPELEPEPSMTPLEKANAILGRGEEEIKLAFEYNVSFVSGTDKVRCNGCMIEYPNLADRMVRKPDNCSGCHQKAAWG